MIYRESLELASKMKFDEMEHEFPLEHSVRENRTTSLFTISDVPLLAEIRDLKHRRRGRQRERQKTIVLISKTLAPHVHYTLWYISLPSSAKQRREMTKFKVLWRT